MDREVVEATRKTRKRRLKVTRTIVEVPADERPMLGDREL
jgi:hypothetical protein